MCSEEDGVAVVWHKRCFVLVTHCWQVFDAPAKMGTIQIFTDLKVDKSLDELILFGARISRSPLFSRYVEQTWPCLDFCLWADTACANSLIF